MVAERLSCKSHNYLKVVGPVVGDNVEAESVFRNWFHLARNCPELVSFGTELGSSGLELVSSGLELVWTGFIWLYLVWLGLGWDPKKADEKHKNLTTNLFLQPD